MTRARTLSALAFVAMLAAPANLTAQSQPQVDDLRRRVEDVEKADTQTSLKARLAELEKQQAENEKLIKDLRARISKLEKPVGRIVPLKKDR